MRLRDALRPMNDVTLFGPEDSAGIVSFALGGVHPHVDAHCLQMLTRADPGEHQQLRRSDGPGADDHFATGAETQAAAGLILCLHAHHPQTVELQTADVDTRHDLKVGILA